MKAHLLLLAFVIGGASLVYQSGKWPPKHPQPLAKSATAPLAAPKGVPLGVGTVVSSHFYPLVPARHVPLRYIYVQAGQRIRKGEVLAKFADHTFVVAHTAGLITLQDIDAAGVTVGPFPQLWFTEVVPFRLRLPLSATNVALCSGQQVLVKNRAHPTQFVLGKVSTVVVEGLSLRIDLRLQTVGAAPVPAGAQVLAEALPPLVQ
jgi:hypothetical protein